MEMHNSYMKRVKYWFIFNRETLSEYGIYQFFLYIYGWYYKFVSFCYSFGSNVACPVCGFGGKKFVSGSTCPKCWSAPRHRLLALYIQNILKPATTNTQVLDIAPNKATSYIFDRKVYGNYVSIDLDSPAAMLNMDLTDLTFEDNKFDLIICYHVLEHIKNDSKAMEEIYRVLKPNGTAILQVPFSGKNGHTFESDDCDYTDGEMNVKLYGHHGHVRRYGTKDYLAKLEDIGFDGQLDNYVETFSDLDITKYGLDKHETLYICRKVE